MLKYISYTISFLFCFTACQTNTSNIEDGIAKEVAALADKKSQRAFLEEIAASDQMVRDEESAINQKYGYNSKEHQQAVQTQVDTDKSNLAKIEAYLAKYGHPNK